MGNFIKVFFVIIFVSLLLCLLYFSLRKAIKVIQKKIVNNYINNISMDSVDSLSGNDFEEFLYCLFLNLGVDVTKTPKSHDYGADLILNINNIKIVVQSKLYLKHSVGASAVQEVFSSTKYYNASYGIVITNSHFSKNAINLAESTNIKLLDRCKLSDLIKFSSKCNKPLNILSFLNLTENN